MVLRKRVGMRRGDEGKQILVEFKIPSPVFHGSAIFYP
jgi:hypothetical protein